MSCNETKHTPQMKFICPKCESEQDVEVYMSDVTASCVIDISEPTELKYGTPELHESTNDHYCCRKCGWELPVEPHAVDDDALIEYLEKQDYNQIETPEAKLKRTPGICPECGSQNVNFGDVEFKDGENYQDCGCQDCGCLWNEYYIFSKKELVKE